MPTGTANARPPNEWRLPEGLNAAQMQQVTELVMRAVEQLQMRKWCAEKALTVPGSDPIRLARELYDFVVPPLPAVIESENE